MKVVAGRKLQNAQANHLFQSILGSKAMLWNFQWVKCLDKHERQNSKKRFEKNEHACSVLEVFVVSDLSAHLYL